MDLTALRAHTRVFSGVRTLQRHSEWLLDSTLSHLRRILSALGLRAGGRFLEGSFAETRGHALRNQWRVPRVDEDVTWERRTQYALPSRTRHPRQARAIQSRSTSASDAHPLTKVRATRSRISSVKKLYIRDPEWSVCPFGPIFGALLSTGGASEKRSRLVLESL